MALRALTGVKKAAGCLALWALAPLWAPAAQAQPAASQGPAPPTDSSQSAAYAPSHQVPATHALGPPDGSFIHGVLGFGPTLRLVNHPELDSVLAEHGLSPLAHDLLAFGLLLQGSVARVRLSFGWDLLRAEQELRRRPESVELVVPVAQRTLSLSAGYDVLQTHGFAVFPSVGFAVGDVQLRYAPDDPLWEDETLEPPADKKDIQPLELTRGFNALDLGVGLEQVIPFSSVRSGRPRFGLALALRLGYRWQLSDTAWTYANEDKAIVTLETGPALDGTGPYAQWVLGIGVTD